MTHPARRSALLLLALGLAGCNARADLPPARFASLDALAGVGAPAGPGVAPRAADAPIVRLPAWIGPQRVVRREGDGPAQRILIGTGAPDGDGRDFGVVRLGRAESDAAVSGKPTEAGIRAELAALFPDTPMQVVVRPARNEHGPYGLAVGRRPDGAGCLYAWQWIEREGGEAASLRLRLCRSRTTLDALAGAVDRVRFDPAGLAPDQAQPARRQPARPRARRLAEARPAASPPPASPPTWQMAASNRMPPVLPATAPAPSSVPRTDLPAEALRGPQRIAGSLDPVRR